ncbi:malonate decarboxylase holo-[acyl-carrier-protein] synthase [Rhodoblastus sp. 17X3]|uniref:malonate decarboxylase holo-[acyl-carrier-protein] synthase n=1 Tax=Rhodoblastus sp. 17X3 TaxID=3047026 RepID=UPI0024B7A7AE|nr:malonate decarboxylase holo-[acyl-carrier-protein] synthase [Rhodoblastus sp. 17X3]MDI9847480.1 malonate decarboxylase holo-[acyl-carrier-protein] synthase [Rhodoblastus sp. 17X3]
MRQADLYRRHDWVYLPDDWRRRLAAPLAAEDEDALARWSEKGRPLVVARRQEGDAPGLLRLGLALPGKRRVGVILPTEAVALRRQPPFFLDVVENGAALWPEAMRELAGVVARIAPEMRVFGSFAWQFFAADPALVYVTRNSDIDLLLTPAHGTQLAAWIALLQNFESRWPAPRLDGEIALPGGDFVAWREFAARPQKILVKGADNVSLRSIEDIDALLSARAA